MSDSDHSCLSVCLSHAVVMSNCDSVAVTYSRHFTLHLFVIVSVVWCVVATCYTTYSPRHRQAFGITQNLDRQSLMDYILVLQACMSCCGLNNRLFISSCQIDVTICKALRCCFNACLLFNDLDSVRVGQPTLIDEEPLAG